MFGLAFQLFGLIIECFSSSFLYFVPNTSLLGLTVPFCDCLPCPLMCFHLCILPGAPGIHSVLVFSSCLRLVKFSQWSWIFFVFCLDSFLSSCVSAFGPCNRINVTASRGSAVGTRATKRRSSGSNTLIICASVHWRWDEQNKLYNNSHLWSNDIQVNNGNAVGTLLHFLFPFTKCSATHKLLLHCNCTMT